MLPQENSDRSQGKTLFRQGGFGCQGAARRFALPLPSGRYLSGPTKLRLRSASARGSPFFLVTQRNH